MHEHFRWTLCCLSLVVWLQCTSAVNSREAKEASDAKKQENISRLRRSSSRNVFLGMRGKKEALWDDGYYDNLDPEGDEGLGFDAAQQDMLRGQAEMVGGPTSSRFQRPFFGVKRVNNFLAMRGKKDPFEAYDTQRRLDSDLKNFLEDKRSRSTGFTAMRGKKDQNDGSRVRRPQSNFFNKFLAPRGKKWMHENREEDMANMEQTEQNKEEGSQPSV